MKYLLFSLIFFMGSASHALTVGIQSVTPSITDKGTFISEAQSNFGFSADFVFAFPIDSTYSLRTGLALAQRSFQINWRETSGLLAGLRTFTKHGFTSLEIPIQLRAKLMDDLSVFGGTRLSGVIAKTCSKEDLSSMGVTVSDEICNGVKTLTTPLELGVHYQFSLGYGVELYYQLALNNLVENSFFDLKVNTIGLNLIFSI